MPTNEFLDFGTGGGANVMSQAAYAALAARPAGFSSGVAQSEQCNKVWRQASFVAHCVAQLICDLKGLDAPDDGDDATFIANLKAAIAAIPTAVGAFVTVNNATYTAVAADRNKTVRMIGTGAGTHNFNLPDPATLDDRWTIRLIVDCNDGDYVTAVPGGAATLDDQATRRAGAGTDVLIQYDGAGFRAVQGMYRFVTAFSAWSAASEVTAAHNFGKEPQELVVRLRCSTAQFGYSVGDTVALLTTNADNFQGMVTTMTDANGNTTRFLIAAGIAVTRKDTHVNPGFVTPGSWGIQLAVACR